MLFKPELCEKILSGEKTQTRRIVKPGEQGVVLGNGSFAEVYTRTSRGTLRTKWMRGRTYAVCPGRGKPQVGRIKIAAIRHERIQDITQADALAELGEELCLDCDRHAQQHWDNQPHIWSDDFDIDGCHPVEAFMILWDRINNKPGMRWDDSPRVWVLEFERVTEAEPTR